MPGGPSAAIKQAYSTATGVAVWVKLGGRFSRNAENASLASLERSRSLNSPPFEFDGRFDLVDETLLEESLACPQCAAGFCSELLRDFHCCREQLLVRYHAGHQAQLRRLHGTEGLTQQE